MTTTSDLNLWRDWAAIEGGPELTAFDLPDFTPFGCGPANANARMRYVRG